MDPSFQSKAPAVGPIQTRSNIGKAEPKVTSKNTNGRSMTPQAGSSGTATKTIRLGQQRLNNLSPSSDHDSLKSKKLSFSQDSDIEEHEDPGVSFDEKGLQELIKSDSWKRTEHAANELGKKTLLFSRANRPIVADPGSDPMASIQTEEKTAKTGTTETPSKSILKSKETTKKARGIVSNAFKKLASSPKGVLKEQWPVLPRDLQGRIKEEVGRGWEKKYKEAVEPHLKEVNKAWQKEYGVEAGNTSQGKIKFSDEVKIRDYSIYESDKGKDSIVKLKSESEVKTKYSPNTIEVNFTKLRGMKNPGESRLENAFVQLVEPNARKREQNFVTAQPAREFFRNCLDEITQKVKSGEINPEESIERLRLLMVGKISNTTNMTKQEFKEKFIEENAQMWVHGKPWSDFKTNKWADNETKDVEVFAYPNAANHKIEVRDYVFGNEPAKFERDKGKTDNMTNYEDFQVALMNHFRFQKAHA